MSFKPVVRTGTDPKFYGNALAFATKEEAEYSARDLMNRWMLVVECKAEESDEPVNYHIDLATGVVTSVEHHEPVPSLAQSGHVTEVPCAESSLSQSLAT